jgi:hypothetical protein
MGDDERGDFDDEFPVPLTTMMIRNENSILVSQTGTQVKDKERTN